MLYRPKQLQTKLEPSEVEYDGEAKKSDISAWVRKNYHGLVGHRTGDNSKDFGRNLVIYISYSCPVFFPSCRFSLFLVQLLGDDDDYNFMVLYRATIVFGTTC